MRDLGFYLLEIQGKIGEKWEFYGKKWTLRAIKTSEKIKGRNYNLRVTCLRNLG